MDVSDPPEERFSQRELRSDSARVLRAVGEGHSFVLPNRGVPVGRICPVDAPSPWRPIVRPAKRIGGWAAVTPQRKDGDRTMTQILDELREDRV